MKRGKMHIFSFFFFALHFNGHKVQCFFVIKSIIEVLNLFA